MNTQPETSRAYIDQGIAFERQGAYEMAEKAYLHGILNFPDDYILYSRLGTLLMNLGRSQEAVLRYERARALKPNDPEVLFNSGIVHQTNEEFETAIGFFQEAAKHGYDKGAVNGSLAEIYEQTNRLEELEAFLPGALAETPGDVFLLFNAAKLERRKGNYETALDLLKKTERKRDFDEVAQIVQFEKGRIFDKIGKPEKAFQAFQKGNLISVRENIQPGMDKRVFLGHVRNYTDLDLQNLTQNAAAMDPDPRQNPAFLIGFPRSGTTLLHQILDGHPDLDILEEQAFIAMIRANLFEAGGSFHQTFATLPASEWVVQQGQLLDTYQQMRTKGPDTKIIDKLPLHILDIPLILKLFPKAKFIVALRHPFDCTLSCFMQNFGLNNAMLNFTNLDDTTRLYEALFSLWQKYEKELDLDYIYVRYEDVVENLEKEARRVIDFLDMEWDPGVLAYREKALSKTRIATPSYHQVVQPIYKDAAGRWKAYEKFFQPFRNRLVPFCETFGYEL